MAARTWPAATLATIGLLLLAVLVAFQTDGVRLREPLRAHLMRLQGAGGAVEGEEPEPLRRWWEPPALADWTTQSDFLLNCSELAPGGIPADHPSNLAPLWNHSADLPIASDALAHKLKAAAEGTQAIKRAAVPAAPLKCLHDSPYGALAPVGSQPKIGIVVGFSAPPDSTDQDSMYVRSLRDKQEYAAQHAYEVIVFGDAAILEGRDLDYLKWVGALAHLRQFDWLWMVDLDTIIMNHSIPLESFLDPRYDLIITRDCNGINTGTQFFRNTTWAFMFIAEVIMHDGSGIRDGPGNWPNVWSIFPEQSVVWKLAEDDRIRNRLKILPQRTFNAYTAQDCAPAGTYQEGDFLVHFAGPGKPRFNEYWAKRKATVPSAAPPAADSSIGASVGN